MAVKIPFIGGSYTGRSTAINAQRCVNLFMGVDKQEAKEEITLHGTPGLKEFCALETVIDPTPIRAVHKMGDLMYAVIGANVYSVTLSGEKTLLGTISTSSGNVFMEDNGTQVLIVDGSATGHYVIAGALNTITDVDYPAADSVAFQDGYFIVTEKDTGQIHVSGLYDCTTWDALDFASAESDPDYAVRVLSSSRELWVFGTDTIEAFYNSGNADFPFERIQGSTMQVGTEAPASVVMINGTLYWLSNSRRVLRNNGYQWEAVSPPTVEYQISHYGTVSDARAYTCTIDSHQWYVLIFPTEKKTWIYDTNTLHWFEWESFSEKLATTPPGSVLVIDTPPSKWGTFTWGDGTLYIHDMRDFESNPTPWSRHRSNCGIRFGNKEIVGDYENGKLYELDMDTLTDDGHQIRRMRTNQYISKDRVNVIYHALEVEFESGVGLSGGVQGQDPLACLEWSDDGGKTWSNQYWTSMGKIGEYQHRAIWRRLGMSRVRTFRLTITDPVKVVILAAYADLEALAS